MAVAHVGPWTEDDLLSLPPDDHRYELLEGALIMNPPPTPSHQRASFLLTRILDSAAPSDLLVVEAVGVRVPDAVFVPDVVVTDRRAAEANRSGILAADAVKLVVEIVSPGSRSMDRLTKPALYARAGIPLYWRVELEDGPTIHLHQREGEAYVEVAIHSGGQLMAVSEPFELAINPDDLIQ